MTTQGENGFLYAESKRAKQEREKAEARKRKMEIPIEFAPEDLALATIPGADFDPKRRHFSADELRPQPIIRKRKKVGSKQLTTIFHTVWRSFCLKLMTCGLTIYVIYYRRHLLMLRHEHSSIECAS